MATNNLLFQKGHTFKHGNFKVYQWKIVVKCELTVQMHTLLFFIECDCGEKKKAKGHDKSENFYYFLLLQ